jgi:hypothetical protein
MSFFHGPHAPQWRYCTHHFASSIYSPCRSPLPAAPAGPESAPLPRRRHPEALPSYCPHSIRPCTTVSALVRLTTRKSSHALQFRNPGQGRGESERKESRAEQAGAMRDSHKLQGGQKRNREASRDRTCKEVERVPAPIEARDDAKERTSREPAGEASATEAARVTACVANSSAKIGSYMRRQQQLRKLEEPPEEHE